MGDRTYTVKELADLAGVSVRTLHYYDEIGLLIPERNESGYRVYGKTQVGRLQEILAMRACAQQHKAEWKFPANAIAIRCRKLHREADSEGQHPYPGQAQCRSWIQKADRLRLRGRPAKTSGRSLPLRFFPI